MQVAADEDFEKLWQMVADNTWKLEYQHDEINVWSKHSNSTDLKMIKVNSFLQTTISLKIYLKIFVYFIQVKTTFTDVDMWLLFDLLMDGEYRSLWDTAMVESYTLGFLNPNNDVGYYASEYF